MPGFAFVSYSRTDRDYVRRLTAFLRKHGIDTWYDADLTTGRSFDQEIAHRIDTCAAFLILLTPEAVASKWVLRELGYADDHDLRIMPLMLRPCRRPLRISNMHYEDIAGGRMPDAGFITELRRVLDTVATDSTPSAIPESGPVPLDAAERIVADIHAAQFGMAGLSDGYDMEEVDSFLDKVAAAIQRREDISAVVADARFAVSRFAEGYDMREVDVFLDHIDARMRNVLARR